MELYSKNLHHKTLQKNIAQQTVLSIRRITKQTHHIVKHACKGLFVWGADCDPHESCSVSLKKSIDVTAEFLDTQKT